MDISFGPLPFEHQSLDGAMIYMVANLQIKLPEAEERIILQALAAAQQTSSMSKGSINGTKM